jgi:hypothetical protein
MWRAVFTDGSILEEYDQFGKEILFSEVMKCVEKLQTLSIVLSSTKTFTIRLKDGRFTIRNDGRDEHFYGYDVTKYDIEKFLNIRPIYFVRETVDFNINNGPGKCTASRVNFVALGFQVNYNDKNFKRYLVIYPDGKYLITDS